MAIGISWNKIHTLHLIVTFSLSKIEWEYRVSITLDALSGHCREVSDRPMQFFSLPGCVSLGAGKAGKT